MLNIQQQILLFKDNWISLMSFLLEIRKLWNYRFVGGLQLLIDYFLFRLHVPFYHDLFKHHADDNNWKPCLWNMTFASTINVSKFKDYSVHHLFRADWTGQIQSKIKDRFRKPGDFVIADNTEAKLTTGYVKWPTEKKISKPSQISDQFSCP